MSDDTEIVVPDDVRRQIADLFRHVVSVRQDVIDALVTYERLDQALAAAETDGADLCDLTGLTAVMDAFGDMAERIATAIGGVTIGMDYDSAELVEFTWPSTAWPIPDAGEEGSATVDEMRAEVRRLDGVVTDHLRVCPSGPRTSSDGGAA